MIHACYSCSETPACMCPAGCVCLHGEKGCECSNAAFADQVKALYPATATLSSQPLGAQDRVTTKDLESRLHDATEKMFSDTYGYEYKAASSAPPGLKEGVEVKNIHKLVNLRTGDVEQARKCFSKLLKDEGNPDWFVDRAVADILSNAGQVFGNSKLGEWGQSTFKKSYDLPGGAGNTVEVNFVYVYAHTDKKVGEDTVVYTFVYYLGVYFGVPK